MKENNPDIPFERYADDAICHCRSEAQALSLRQALEARLAACKLELHPQKTKIVYCKDSNRPNGYPEQRFDFLGFTFRPRQSMNRAGKLFVSFSPAVSDKAAKARVLSLIDHAHAAAAKLFNDPVMREGLIEQGDPA